MKIKSIFYVLLCMAFTLGIEKATQAMHAIIRPEVAAQELIDLIKSKENIRLAEKLNALNPNIRNEQGISPLHAALLYNNTEAMMALAKNNPNLTIENNLGFTPLMSAAISNNFDVVKILVEKGVNPNATNSEGKYAIELTNNPQIKEFLEKHMRKNQGNYEPVIY
jgi:ankyrin repeat protein